MVQKVHHVHKSNYLAFPSQLTIKDVHIWTDGKIALHDYACPVCRKEPAVLDLNSKLMQPCRGCQAAGYELVKRKKPWWKHLIS